MFQVKGFGEKVRIAKRSTALLFLCEALRRLWDRRTSWALATWRCAVARLIALRDTGTKRPNGVQPFAESGGVDIREFHAEELRTAELLGRLALRLMCVGMCQRRFRTLRLCKSCLVTWRLKSQTAMMRACGANQVHEEIARWRANAEKEHEECLKWKAYATEAHSLAATIRDEAGELDLDRAQMVRVMRDAEVAAEAQIRHVTREAATVTTKRAVRAMVQQAYRVHFLRWAIRSQEQRLSTLEAHRLRDREEALETKACEYVRAREAELEAEAQKMEAQVEALIRRKRSDYRTDAAAAMLDEKEMATVSSRLWEVNKIFEPWAERERLAFDPATAGSQAGKPTEKEKLKSLLYESEKRELAATKKVAGLERELAKKAQMVLKAQAAEAIATAATEEANRSRGEAEQQMQDSKRDLDLALREVGVLRDAIEELRPRTPARPQESVWEVDTVGSERWESMEASAAAETRTLTLTHAWMEATLAGQPDRMRHLSPISQQVGEYLNNLNAAEQELLGPNPNIPL